MSPSGRDRQIVSRSVPKLRHLGSSVDAEKRVNLVMIAGLFEGYATILGNFKRKVQKNGKGRLWIAAVLKQISTDTPSSQPRTFL